MNSVETLREFLGWCSVINIGVLLLSSIMVVLMRGWIVKLHARMTGIDEEELPVLYFKILGNYKMLIVLFNVVPYIALRIMS